MSDQEDLEFFLIISTIVAITLYISPLLTTILAEEPSAPLGLAENSISKAGRDSICPAGKKIVDLISTSY
mgnify:CR=1 FL=1